MKSLLIITFITFSLAEYHIVIPMLTAPKRLPMIVYTADYIVNAYKYGHPGIVIDAIFLSNGCNGCKNPDILEAAKIFREAGINTILTNITSEDYDNEQFYSHLMDIYESIFPLRGASDYVPFGHKKFNRINYYFYKTADMAVKQYPLFDYVLFLEDDQAFYKNAFFRLKKLFDSYNLTGDHVETHLIPNVPSPESDNAKGCIWGYYGKLQNRKEYFRFRKLAKFDKWIRCGDIVQCLWVDASDMPSRRLNLGHHFGRDSYIKRYDPKYYN
ncbi:hypothetical protein EHI8A_189100 [Entamoeba histolytica HM-1:IMSS-B]|nr:Hypothetical protein EHI5A_075380 [Entamoeba histolytica KU27]EMH74530.1 hypothetical protein EHI8A_189100 [Entamoeba histolytica HM-1:IMSS-B]GAT94314.1 hypothetical protein CL6EHI_174880 [Entamoeba histolytica]